MKQAMLVMQINVPNDFETGDCKKCPLSVTSYYSTGPQYIEENRTCKISCTPMTCPILPNEGDKQ